ncbi:MAG: TIM barrel protein, partial [Clostridiales bacterium]|nr:TIM barrel protein [Clostridiales bacterium]
MIRIGPSGNSETFYQEGHKHTYEAAEWLHRLGLNAYEYSFGRGVMITPAGTEKIREAFQKYGVEISAHAPYYTNFANEASDMIEKSIGYILQSIEAIKQMGGVRVVFHPASCGKATRAEALSRAERNIALMIEKVHETFD